MTTSGAPTRPRFKRSSPRKKSQLRSRRLAAGEAEAAGGPALARAPLPSPLEVDAVPRIGHALPREFFEVDALDLAPRLLGKLLRRDEVILRITEVTVLQNLPLTIKIILCYKLAIAPRLHFPIYVASLFVW
jgi:DNA-3-methyladenine glycosylase